MICAERKKASDLNSVEAAFLVHDELLFSWLVTLVWRQRNIRECQIGRNVFKGEIPALVNLALPQWAQEKLRTNPREQFWQFHFNEDETKTHREVRSILPRRLVPLLEKYLNCYRPMLLRDPGGTNLFLNRKGDPLTLRELTRLVSNLTARYGQRRVTPHLVRDIFSFWWLKHHPRDYLTLSKMLWHTNIQTTVRTYGSRFDESHALCQNRRRSRKSGWRTCARSARRRFQRAKTESRPTQAQLQPKIQPRKALTAFRKSGSGPSLFG